MLDKFGLGGNIETAIGEADTHLNELEEFQSEVSETMKELRNISTGLDAL